MMYDNKFVLSIIHGGQPVREINRTVHLPYNSEYKIRLKNKHFNLRAKARVSIDGRQVSNLGDFILNPGETLDLERFLDHSMSQGNRFQFVPLSDSRVNDPTDFSNGIVKVEFFREKDFYNNPKPPIKIDPIKPGPCWPRLDSDSVMYGSSCSTKGTTSRSFSSNNCVPTAMSFTCNTVIGSSQGGAGATVEGGVSNQNFVYGADFETEPFPTVLTLTIRGLNVSRTEIVRTNSDVSVVRPKIRYCSSCGARRKKRIDNFCWRCGNRY